MRVEREIEVLPRAGEVLGELRFGFGEDGMARVFSGSGEANASRAVVGPEDGDEAFVAGDELEFADG